MTATIQKVKSSFRDPGGQVFTAADGIYRLVRGPAAPHYHALMESGLYTKLTDLHLLVPHEDVTDAQARLTESGGDIVIRPRRVPFISYPFEWTFSALKEAALNTLKIQKLCLDHSMTLQDASAFNMQFLDGYWMMIDTGSFRQMPAMAPWGAYRQFCQHFLAPLLLMAYTDTRVLALFSKNLDGIPLDLAARLLPLSAWLRPAVYMHIVMHSRYMNHDFSARENAADIQECQISKASAYGLIDQLEGLISSLRISKKETAWTAYEGTHTYKQEEFRDKENFIRDSLAEINHGRPLSLWDMGANTGHFSRLMAEDAPEGSSIVALEHDGMTGEAGYAASRSCVKNRPLHLWMDILNPTPDCGWGQEEWDGLFRRGPADMVLILALVHHLCLSGNVSFTQIADFLNRIGHHIVVEFVPKDDPQARRLLKGRRDIYESYTQAEFENAMNLHFSLIASRVVSSTGRTLYFMKRHA